MPITNKDRFPDVDFLPDNKIRKVGTLGDTPLVLIGFEQGTDAPVVSQSRTGNPATEELFAVPLYELLSHTLDPVSIPEPITRE